MDDLHDFATQAAAVSSADQSTAALVNVASDVAAYHRKLLKDGVSKALAADLTMMAASYWLQRRFGGCDCEGE